MRVLALVSLRGGVGKTSMAMNVASSMAEMVRDQIHLVDLDPQAGLTLACGYRPDHAELVRLERFGENQVSLRGLRSPLIGGSPDLLREELSEISKGHHITIIDCGPGLNEVTQVALSLADLALLLLAPSPTAPHELESFVEHSAQFSAPPLLRVVAVRSSPSAEWFARLKADRRSTLARVFYVPSVPEDAQIAEALRLGLPVDWFAPDSAAGQVYRSLALVLEYDLRKAKVERFLARHRG